MSVRQSPSASPRRKWTASGGAQKLKLGSPSQHSVLVPSGGGSGGSSGALRSVHDQPLSLGSPFAPKSLSPSPSCDGSRGPLPSSSSSSSRKLVRRHSMSPTVSGSVSNFVVHRRHRHRCRTHVFVICVVLAAICSAVMFLVMARMPAFEDDMESTPESQGVLSESRQSGGGRELGEGHVGSSRGGAVRKASTVEQRVAMLEEQQRQLELRQRQKEEEDRQRKKRLEQQQQRLQQLLSTVPDHKGHERGGSGRDDGRGKERETEKGQPTAVRGQVRGGRGEQRRGPAKAAEGAMAGAARQVVARKEDPRKQEQSTEHSQGHAGHAAAEAHKRVQDGRREAGGARKAVGQVRSGGDKVKEGRVEDRPRNGREGRANEQILLKKQRPEPRDIGEEKASRDRDRARQEAHVEAHQEHAHVRRDFDRGAGDQGQGGRRGGAASHGGVQGDRAEEAMPQKRHAEQDHAAIETGPRKRRKAGDREGDAGWAERDAHLKQKGLERGKRTARREVEEARGGKGRGGASGQRSSHSREQGHVKAREERGQAVDHGRRARGHARS